MRAVRPFQVKYASSTAQRVRQRSSSQRKAVPALAGARIGFCHRLRRQLAIDVRSAKLLLQVGFLGQDNIAERDHRQYNGRNSGLE